MTTKSELQRDILFERWVAIVESHKHIWRIDNGVFQLGVSCGESADDVIWFDIDSTRALWIELGY